MTKETQTEALNMMIFWAKQFAILREEWYSANGQEFIDLRERVASVAKFAIRYCEEAGLNPNEVMQQEVHFLKIRKQRLQASA